MCSVCINFFSIVDGVPLYKKKWTVQEKRIEESGKMADFDKYDTAFLGILQNEGTIINFLDTVFSFLYRRYICECSDMFFVSC